MKDSEIHYYLSGLKNLHELFLVIDEIKSETGMTPDMVKYGDKKLKYNGKDGKSLKNGELDEETYISRNQIS
ncbi:hypothetical protein [Bacteroides sp. GM023]|uniref:hypothetical protein n=1 Tax=Bacteroides sp. GM023 TaxID=2723058 RepID=UPI00168B0C8B|nr:hypothetical protein [Bacteroides sp. GM023]MBD3589568.1 hypothetical protein [Bacteroides sp. GM023]